MSNSHPALRGFLVVVSLLAIAWLGGNLLSRHDADEGNDSLARAKAQGWPPAELERAQARFDRARRFASDTDLLVKQASALVFLGAPRRAAPLLERAVRAEPENATAWLFLFVAVRERDPARAAVARRRALELDPLAKRVLDAGQTSR